MCFSVFSVTDNKQSAKMCCSGFLKIMMFIFNGGIFVSWNKDDHSFSVSAVKLILIVQVLQENTLNSMCQRGQAIY